MCPLARAASKTASILARSREAVSGIDCHIGCKTERTASVSTSSTGRPRSGLAYSVSVIFHCALCFSLRHSEALASRSSSAHWPNGFLPDSVSRAFRRAVIGLMPAATSLRASAALSRASASETAAPPRPISFGLPARVKRMIHFLAPLGVSCPLMHPTILHIRAWVIYEVHSYDKSREKRNKIQCTELQELQ